jgi:hypothetical protein
MFLSAAISLLLIVAGFYFRFIPPVSFPGQFPTPVATPVILGDQTQTSPTSTPRPVIKVPATIVMTPPPATPVVSTGDLTQFVYPGAVIISQSTDQLRLSTGDDADTVTNWYEQKIKAGGANIKSFVKTNTNGNVNNSLSGSGGNLAVNVNIKKTPGSQTTITVAP